MLAVLCTLRGLRTTHDTPVKNTAGRMLPIFCLMVFNCDCAKHPEQAALHPWASRLAFRVRERADALVAKPLGHGCTTAFRKGAAPAQNQALEVGDWPTRRDVAAEPGQVICFSSAYLLGES
jgi:hypothetical protein